MRNSRPGFDDHNQLVTADQPQGTADTVPFSVHSVRRRLEQLYGCRGRRRSIRGHLRTERLHANRAYESVFQYGNHEGRHMPRFFSLLSG
uniref:Uncharacterized protein n=1 Tax=Pseudomonas fluorescens (strain SBW25) TaxID=216595 RepID=A4V6X5_PSEFS|nr:hypothetical protein pQBR0254 [Pseudomonas fluorescens SBW25]